MAGVTLSEVYKSFGKNEVIHGISCDIQDGEFVVILGPSGCGKSTLLRMIAGLEKITAGEVAIGLALLVEINRHKRAVNIDEINSLRG